MIVCIIVLVIIYLLLFIGGITFLKCFKECYEKGDRKFYEYLNKENEKEKND